MAMMFFLNYIFGIFIFFSILKIVSDKTKNSLKWILLTLVFILISIPIIQIIFSQNLYYQRSLLFILPIMSSIATGAVLFLVMLPLFYIERKYGLLRYVKDIKETLTKK